MKIYVCGMCEVRFVEWDKHPHVKVRVRGKMFRAPVCMPCGTKVILFKRSMKRAEQAGYSGI